MARGCDREWSFVHGLSAVEEIAAVVEVGVGRSKHCFDRVAAGINVVDGATAG